MSLAVVPAQVPTATSVAAEELTGEPLEQAARAELCRALALTVTVHAPTWRQIMFMGSPIRFQVPDVPEGVAGRIGALKPEAFGKDAVGLAALALAEKMQQAKPKGTFRRAVAPGLPLPAGHGQIEDWNRLVFIVTAGPPVAALLVSAAYLTSQDVDTLEDNYPKGLEQQRLEAVAGATALTHAAARVGTDPHLASWVNDQTLLLMDEERPVDVFQALYNKKGDAPPADGAQGGGGQGPTATGQSRLANSFRPAVGAGDGTT